MTCDELPPSRASASPQPLLDALDAHGLRHAHADPGAGDRAADGRAATSSASPRPAPARPRPSRLPILHQHPRARTGRPAPKTCRALILAPTRELAVQIEASFRTLRRRRAADDAADPRRPVAQQPRSARWRRGVDVVIATPGRLIDLMDDRPIRLDETRFVVLDEADRMLDMGFIQPVRRIVARAASAAPVGALLGDHAARGRRARRRASCAIRCGSRSRRRRPRSSASSRRVELIDDRGQARPAGRSSSATRASAAAIVFARTKRGADRVAREPRQGRRRGRGDPRQQGAERPPAGAERASATARSGCWSPPTSSRAASTCRASPTSSTTTCPTSRRATCTASAAPAATARTASRSRSARPDEIKKLRAVEKVIQQIHYSG